MSQKEIAYVPEENVYAPERLSISGERGMFPKDNELKAQPPKLGLNLQT